MSKPTKESKWQPIHTMPYDKTVYVINAKDIIIEDVWYDSTLTEYLNSFSTPITGWRKE